MTSLYSGDSLENLNLFVKIKRPNRSTQQIFCLWWFDDDCDGDDGGDGDGVGEDDDDGDGEDDDDGDVMVFHAILRSGP